MKPLTLTYSLADQNFTATKSLGIFNVSVQLLEHLARRPEVSRLTVLINSGLEGRLNLPATIITQRHDHAARSRLGRILWDQRGVYRAARRSGNEWLFLPKGFASILGAPPVKLVTYVHDTMLDFYEQNYPGTVPWAEQRYFKMNLLASLRRSRLIVTNSEFTRSEVTRFARAHRLPIPPAHTVGIGFTRPVKTPLEKQDRVVVLASRFPHKRTDLAVAYLKRWCDDTGFRGFVDWVGVLPPGCPLPPYDHWRLYPRPEDFEYRKLLATAKASVYFSEYEGFGMPPIEAAMAGACPVYSDLPATREVMRGAGFSFTTNSYDAFAHALDKALSTPTKVIDDWADQLSLTHSWDAVCTRFISLLLEHG